MLSYQKWLKNAFNTCFSYLFCAPFLLLPTKTSSRSGSQDPQVAIGEGRESYRGWREGCARWVGTFNTNEVIRRTTVRNGEESAAALRVYRSAEGKIKNGIKKPGISSRYANLMPFVGVRKTRPFFFASATENKCSLNEIRKKDRNTKQ